MASSERFGHITFVHAWGDSTHIYGLDGDGHIWWRKTPHTYGVTKLSEADRVWKRLSSRARSGSDDEDTEDEGKKEVSKLEVATIPSEANDEYPNMGMLGALAAGYDACLMERD